MSASLTDQRLKQLEIDLRRLDEEVARETGAIFPNDNQQGQQQVEVLPPVSVHSIENMTPIALRARIMVMSEEMNRKEVERDRLLQLVENCYARLEKFRELRRKLKDSPVYGGGSAGINSASAAIASELQLKDEQIAQLKIAVNEERRKLDEQRSKMKAIRDGSLATMNALQEQVAKLQQTVVQGTSDGRVEAEELRLEASRAREALEQSRHSELCVRDDLRELCAAGLHILDSLHVSDMPSRHQLDNFRRQLQQAQQVAADCSQRRVNEIVNENRMLWQEIHNLRQEMRRRAGDAAAAVPPPAPAAPTLIPTVSANGGSYRGRSRDVSPRSSVSSSSAAQPAQTAAPYGDGQHISDRGGNNNYQLTTRPWRSGGSAGSGNNAYPGASSSSSSSTATAPVAVANSSASNPGGAPFAGGYFAPPSDFSSRVAYGNNNVSRMTPNGVGSNNNSSSNIPPTAGAGSNNVYSYSRNPWLGDAKQRDISPTRIQIPSSVLPNSGPSSSYERIRDITPTRGAGDYLSYPSSSITPSRIGAQPLRV